MKVPFLKLTFGKEEKRAINDVLDSGWVAMGKKTQEFEEKFAEYVGAKYTVFVDSGTAALFLGVSYWQKRLGYIFMKIEVPSLTFTSTVEVIVHAGLKAQFVDVNRKTFCLDSNPDPMPFSLPVHLTGNKAKRKAFIYDSAHRIQKNDMAEFPDSLLCYSFYATKNITTINGGMIATNDSSAVQWLKKARDHGISKGTQERYENGEWEYSIDFIGWREKADDVRAAIGIEQLKKIDWINSERQRVLEHYNSRLGLQRTGNHIFPILVDKRPEFVNFMRSRGIQTAVHFLPLHRMPAYRRFSHENLENTEYLGDRLVSLPMYPQLSNEEIDYVVKAVENSKLMIPE